MRQKRTPEEQECVDVFYEYLHVSNKDKKVTIDNDQIDSPDLLLFINDKPIACELTRITLEEYMKENKYFEKIDFKINQKRTIQYPLEPHHYLKSILDKKIVKLINTKSKFPLI